MCLVHIRGERSEPRNFSPETLLNPRRLAVQYLQEGAYSLRFWPRSSYMGALFLTTPLLRFSPLPLFRSLKECTGRQRGTIPGRLGHFLSSPTALFKTMLVLKPRRFGLWHVRAPAPRLPSNFLLSPFTRCLKLLYTYLRCLR
jgi:hypothetical protein